MITNINIEKFISMSIPALNGFKLVEPREWDIEATLMELGTEIGSLGRVLSIWEHYRHGKRSRHNMADELSDILFIYPSPFKNRGGS